MKKSRVVQKWREGKLARTSVMGLVNPAFIAQSSRSGFDAVWIDNEHRGMSNRELQSLMAFCRVYDVDCIVRPPTIEKTPLYRYLEDGATGLLIPHVGTAEKARELVNAVKFPPLGDRGLDGSGFDGDFQAYDPDKFVKWANEETYLIVLIETPEGVDNLDEIAAVEGVDALFLGPGDLGLRYRQAGDDGTLLEAAYGKMAAAAEKHGKQWAAPAIVKEDIARRHDQGCRLIVHGNEFSAVKSMLTECGGDFDEIE
ncbi:aldolase/citrate lyase family protein [Verrucomicrobiales bacterium]|nr:aldolase/citrate lyase family protein [Verrucomicrobiales bacterium]MDC0322515.1 aldolase/citrate lyase family protein [Verrucomicrobiales bacterium]